MRRRRRRGGRGRRRGRRRRGRGRRGRRARRVIERRRDEPAHRINPRSGGANSIHRHRLASIAATGSCRHSHRLVRPLVHLDVVVDDDAVHVQLVLLQVVLIAELLVAELAEVFDDVGASGSTGRAVERGVGRVLLGLEGLLVAQEERVGGLGGLLEVFIAAASRGTVGYGRDGS